MVEARPDEAAPYVQAVPGEGGLDKRPELAMPRIVRPHQRNVAKDIFGHLADAGVGKADIVLEDLLGHSIADRVEARRVGPDLRQRRSGERRVGKEGVSTCRARWWTKY